MRIRLALGVDVGGTNTAFGVCNSRGDVFYEHVLPTKEFEKPEDLVNTIYDLLDEAGFLQDIIGIGIGAPNGNYYSGTIEFAPNLSWKGVIPLAGLFERKFGKPSTLTNDANAAAIGEFIYGCAKDLSHFVTITLGTGLGSGIVCDKRLVYGHDGFAGEYGHIRVIPDGRLCGCGKRGCLETYASSTGVVRSVDELESKNKKSSSLNKKPNLSALEVFEAAKSGDIFALEIIEYTAKILGNSLADFACFNSPQAYVLFGGIAQSGQPFADKVKRYMEEELLNIYRDKIDIRVSSLHDKNAAILGASSLVWNDLV
ncbi:MAG: glucokinase [Flavobacteriaceae bacterium]|jgi:glucokinase